MERFNNRTDGYHIFRFIITTNKKKKTKEEEKEHEDILVKNSYHLPLI